MSDSDSEFEIDFISSAASKTQKKLKTTFAEAKFVPESKSDDCDDDDDFMESQAGGNEEKKRSTPDRDVICISPYISPAVRRPTKRSKKAAAHLRRQVMRSKKTSQALCKLTKAQNNLNKQDSDDSDEIVELSDEEAKEVEIKIAWQHQVKRITANLCDRFSVLFDRFSSEIGEPNSALIDFYLDGRILNRAGIVKDARLDKTKILEARRRFTENANKISVKLQTKDRRKVQTLKIGPTDKLVVMMKEYADIANLSLSQLKFFFDGDLLDPEMTPDDVEIEGGECIDVVY